MREGKLQLSDVNGGVGLDVAPTRGQAGTAQIDADVGLVGPVLRGQSRAGLVLFPGEEGVKRQSGEAVNWASCEQSLWATSGSGGLTREPEGLPGLPRRPGKIPLM